MEEPLKRKRWEASGKLSKNMDAVEYALLVLGLILLKYVSDAFEELYQNLRVEKYKGAAPNDKNEYPTFN